MAEWIVYQNIHSTERTVGRAFVLADAMSDESSSSKLRAFPFHLRSLYAPNMTGMLDFTTIKTCTAGPSSTGDETVSLTGLFAQ
jgi:hypothetical protein